MDDTTRRRRIRRPGRCALALLAGVLGSSAAFAQLRIDITRGVDDAVPVAVVPFGGDAGVTPGGVGGIIAADLERSGRFAPMDPKDMIEQPQPGDPIRFNDWRLLRTDYLVVGRVQESGADTTISYELYNVVTGQRLLGESLTAPTKSLRMTAHRAADRIYEKLTGVRGAFATRVAYVSVDGTPPSQRYRLMVADSDGHGAVRVAETGEPLMSPAWSPDGKMLAYVSFEGKTAAIWVQQLASGERRRVSARAGINGAPAWSPDGRRLALTLSRDSNLDIYLLDLASQTLTRVTSDDAIDTEPAWAPDGRTLYFTSDRAGGPQVYRVALAEARRAERVTFEGSYNARPRISPDGTRLAMVTLDRGGYRIAAMDLETRALRVLSTSSQDESPSFAPNGAALIYGTKSKGRGALAIVSADGRYQQQLSSDAGDVRDPVWSPYLGPP
jgi:TolB protein